jgi:hypothetical protein
LVENCFSQQTNEERHRRRRWPPARQRGIYRTYTTTFPAPACIWGQLTAQLKQSRFSIWRQKNSSAPSRDTRRSVSSDRSNQFEISRRGVCDAFGCGPARTLTFGLGEALASGNAEGAPGTPLMVDLASALGLAFTGGAVGELEAFAGLGSALGISVAYNSEI